MDQTPHRVALASLPALVIAGRWADEAFECHAEFHVGEVRDRILAPVRTVRGPVARADFGLEGIRDGALRVDILVFRLCRARGMD
jgi:hypothetical protein